MRCRPAPGQADGATGNTFSDSNAAAQLAGYTLERVYGIDFDTLVRRHIADPLGMQDTGIVVNEEQRRRCVSGYENGKRQPYFPDQTQAAGALKSTLADMLAYADWQLAERDPAVRLSHQPVYRDGDVFVALNWQVVEKERRRVISRMARIPVSPACSSCIRRVILPSYCCRTKSIPVRSSACVPWQTASLCDWTRTPLPYREKRPSPSILSEDLDSHENAHVRGW
ncbi:serine hydrolase domain-containing protein [Massilia sp. TN1-12]|uniref:serine hydrolase domain-containing protein n=1 Tax=Massilia paldalensis TaxID=3377675 RepID=UPI00384DAF31